MSVTIEYCVPCGHLERAIELQRDLLVRYGGQLHGVTLKTGTGGVLKISVDGRLVLDAAADGFALEGVTEAIDAQVAA